MQRYEFDVNGYFVIKGHYSAAQVATFNAGIDELQAVPVSHAAYTALGIATAGGTGAAMLDPGHQTWHGAPLVGRENNRVDMLICGTDKFDAIVRPDRPFYGPSADSVC